MTYCTWLKADEGNGCHRHFSLDDLAHGVQHWYTLAVLLLWCLLCFQCDGCYYVSSVTVVTMFSV